MRPAPRAPALRGVLALRRLRLPGPHDPANRPRVGPPDRALRPIDAEARRLQQVPRDQATRGPVERVHGVAFGRGHEGLEWPAVARGSHGLDVRGEEGRAEPMTPPIRSDADGEELAHGALRVERRDREPNDEPAVHGSADDAPDARADWIDTWMRDPSPAFIQAIAIELQWRRQADLLGAFLEQA